MTTHRHFLFFGLALAVLAAGCRPTPANAPAPSATAWAVVNGKEISQDDVEKAYRRVASTAPNPSPEEVLSAKLGLLNELIVQELILAKARELKIEVADTELDQAYADAKKNIPDEAFQKELESRKLTAAEMREGLRRDLITQKVFEREVLSKITVTDQEVSAFYEANRAQFNRPEDAFHVAQIAVTPVREPQITNRTGDDATTPQEAEAKARMLMDRLKAGAAFRELAADYSEDAESAPRGGDLGFMPVSQVRQAPPLLRDAVFKTKPGNATLVSVSGSHTIVLVVAYDTAGQKDLSMPQVKDAITSTLRGRREQLMRAAYLTALRNDATVNNVMAKRLVETQGKLPTITPQAP
jgi:peptidyl-prolyl cis-trans isomerase SurA